MERLSPGGAVGQPAIDDLAPDSPADGSRRDLSTEPPAGSAGWGG